MQVTSPQFKANAREKIADKDLRRALDKLQGNFVKGRADRVTEFADYQGFRTAAAGNSGAKCDARYKPCSARRPLKSSTVLTRAGIPCSSGPAHSHFQPSAPAAAPAPNVTKARRVRRVASSIFGHLEARHHGAEVIPTRLDHLPDMHQEETHISHCQPEMKEARHFIAAE